MNNLNYFEFSQSNKDSVEEFINPEGIKVINENKSEEPTNLMNKAEKLNDYITTYYTLKTMKKNSRDTTIIEIVDKIAKILEAKKVNINYHPFCAYFQVMRYSYANYRGNYKSMELEEKRDLIIYLLEAYLENRYKMYQYHGYSHIALQTMADVSSSRRNATIGIKMLKSMLTPLGFINAEDYETLQTNNLCYVESDKKGKKIFKDFLKKNHILFEFQTIRDNKYPDMLIKVKKHYFILEHKLTNGGGGSQNAEINEIISFITFNEENTNIHYVSCLQGDFINYLCEHPTSKKNITQKENITKALTSNPNNYFVNGKALEKLIKDYMK